MHLRHVFAASALALLALLVLPATGADAATIDDFEDNGITEYTEDTTEWTTSTASAHDGTYGLEHTGSSRHRIISTSGLDNYPAQGDTFEAWFQLNDADSRFLFGVQDSTNYYYTLQRSGTEDFRLLKRVDDSPTELVSSAWSADVDTWYRLEVGWETDGTITVTVYDESGTQQTQVQATDTTFTSGGIGFRSNDANGYFDSALITGTNEAPTASFTHSCTDFDCSFDASESSDPDGTIESYDWDFGDGNTGTGETTTHTYDSTGDYTVELTVTDDDGDTGTTTEAISITESGVQVIDDFGDNDISEYTEDTTEWTTSTASVHDGTYGLEHTGSGGNKIISTSGLDNYPAQGDTFEAWFQLNDADSRFLFGVQDSTNYYYTLQRSGTEDFRLLKRVDDSPTELVSSAWSADVDTWYRLEVGWETDGTITVTVYDESGTQQTQVQATDTTFTSGGIGFRSNDANGYFDSALITGTNEAPTASFTSDCTDLDCSFDASGSSDPDGSITSYDWDFGDGNTGTGETVSHTYDSGGDYTVELTVTDDDGATDTTNETVSVTEGSDDGGSDISTPTCSGGQLCDWGAVDQPLNEVNDVANVTDGRWGDGATGFDDGTSSSEDVRDFFEIRGTDIFDAWTTDQGKLPIEYTIFASVDYSDHDTTGREKFVHFLGWNNENSNSRTYFWLDFSDAGDADDGNISLILSTGSGGSAGHDDVSTTVNDGEFTFAIRVTDEDSDGFQEVEFFKNGVSLGDPTELSEKPTLTFEEMDEQGISIGCGPQFQDSNRCKAGDHWDQGTVYDLRFYGEALGDEGLDDLFSADGETQLGSETNHYTFGDGVTTVLSDTSQTGPEPVDFAEGIRNAVKSLGFQTTESLSFFALAIVGITTVGTSAGLNVMGSGRDKNIAIMAAAVLMGLFMVIIQVLEAWMYVVSLIVAGFAIGGGAQIARNTFEDIADRTRREIGQFTSGGSVEDLGPGGSDPSEPIPADEDQEGAQAPGPAEGAPDPGARGRGHTRRRQRRRRGLYDSDGSTGEDEPPPSDEDETGGE